MNEKISEKLLEYMQRTDDFFLEQSPALIKQALEYEKISAWLEVVIFTSLLLGAMSIAYYSWKHPSLDKYGTRETGSFLGVFMPLIFIPLVLVGIYSSIDTLIKISIAPKYFLLKLL